MLKRDSGGILPFIPGPNMDKDIKVKVTNIPLYKLVHGFFSSSKVPIHHKRIAILFLKEELQPYEPELVTSIENIENSVYPEKK